MHDAKFWTPENFRAVVSGHRRGVGAAALRLALAAGEAPYAAAMRLRNWRYDRDERLVTRVGAPVISVGNLTLGGTGKTPMVEWIARWLRQRGLRVAIVSRGYGSENGGRNDEAMELEERLPDVPHVQNADRVAAAQLAVEEFETEVIVLDDAFQHRRIARDLDLVLLDATEPFGYGHVFPRGMLREPLAGLRRADLVVLSRADSADAAVRDSVRRVVERYAPRAGWVEVAHAPTALRTAVGGERPAAELAGLRVAAFCGIGNPAGFRHTLTRSGAIVVDLREFRDHHAYTRADVDELRRWADSVDADAVVCTHKDMVKIGLERLGSKPLAAVVVGLEFLAGQELLEARLAALLPPKTAT